MERQNLQLIPLDCSPLLVSVKPECCGHRYRGVRAVRGRGCEQRGHRLPCCTLQPEEVQRPTQALACLLEDPRVVANPANCLDDRLGLTPVLNAKGPHDFPPSQEEIFLPETAVPAMGQQAPRYHRSAATVHVM